VPSGNSMAAYALLRLHFITQNSEYYDKAVSIIKSCLTAAIENPFGFGQLLISIYLFIRKPIEIIIIKKNKGNSETIKNDSLNSLISNEFMPNKISLVVDPISNDYQKLISENICPILKTKEIRSTTANKSQEIVYICKDFTCSLPIDNKNALEKYLSNLKKSD